MLCFAKNSLTTPDEALATASPVVGRMAGDNAGAGLLISPEALVGGRGGSWAKLWLAVFAMIFTLISLLLMAAFMNLMGQ